jgi:hypothetical protein
MQFSVSEHAACLIARSWSKLHYAVVVHKSMHANCAMFQHSIYFKLSCVTGREWLDQSEGSMGATYEHPCSAKECRVSFGQRIV